MNFTEAGEKTYRFAFTGQVMDTDSRGPVSQFTISLLGTDPALNSVLNGLGDKNGIFHLSRNPSIRDVLFQQAPVLISAPGFEPLLQTLELGADCKAEPCPESRPQRLWLRPMSMVVQPLLQNVPALNEVTRLMDQKGVSVLFKNMTSLGKTDTTLTGELARAQNRDLISNVLVFLKPLSSSQAPDEVAKLFGSVPLEALKGLSGANAGMASSLVPLLANSNPKLGAQLVGLSGLLSYLTPISGAVSDRESGPLGQVVAGLLSAKDPQVTWLNLSQALQSQPNRPQLAMPGLVPFVSGAMEKVQGATGQPFTESVMSSLKNPSLLSFIGSLAKVRTPLTGDMKLLVEYAQPLLQGLVAKNASEVATLFNTLVQEGGLTAIKEFASLPNREKFVKLVPYLEPLVRGLNSQDSPYLAAVLMPFVEQKNPALALRELVTKGTGSLAVKGQVAATLFPALPQILNQSVPAKQVFTAQLLNGLVSGDLADVHVIQDVTGMGLVLSGQARDLFKIAQLPNVERMMIVK